MKTVTVFVRPIGGQHHANTHAQSALSAISGPEAARACAARHLGVPEKKIHLDWDSHHVAIASVLPDPRKHALWVLGTSAAFFALLAAALWLFWRDVP